MAEGSRRFATTRWSLVLAAGDVARPDARDALQALCSAYWYPVYAFFRRSARGAEEASDLTQELFSQMIARNDFRAADPARGRFRSWLLRCAKSCLANEHDRATAQKRGGGEALLSIDETDAEGRYRHEPVESLTPDKLYERRWAMTIVTRALAALREDCIAKGKLAFYDRVKGLLSLGGVAEDPDYDAIGKDVDTTPGAAKTAVSRLRDRYTALLREQIEETVESPDDVEEEWRHLRAALEE